MAFRDSFEAAAAVLTACHSGVPWDPAALDHLIDANSGALFSHVVEPLCDAFEPAYCDAYADLFAAVLSRAAGLDARTLRDRYEQIRHPLPFMGEATHVYVLSRITLGADIAVTSVLMDAAKQRFPEARIYFVGPAKNFELFDADPRLEHVPAPYQRHGPLSERIAASLSLRESLPPGALLLDPDSRLSQLGLLPVAPPERHLFFESRSYGGRGEETITTLAQRWARQTLGVSARSYVRTRAAPAASGGGAITVSLGVGENPAKRVADPFEAELMAALAATGRPVLADLGAGGEEESRVRSAIANAPSSGRIGVWKGSFANFVASISSSSLYVGYDSSGQHAAAALDVPRITVFAGFPNERFFARWQPGGDGPGRAVRAGEGPRAAVAAVKAAIIALGQLNRT